MSGRLGFWVITVAAVLGIAVTAALGRWQLGRAAEKEALQASIEERDHLPMLDASNMASREDDQLLLHRRVQARGSWLPERTVFLDNRQMNGRPGLFVVTPLRLSGTDAVVLVQRGWVPRNFEDRMRLPDIATPAGEVTVQGHIATAPSRLYEMGPTGSGAIRQNLDLAQFRVETGLPLLDLSIRQSGVMNDGLLREWPQINTGVEKHYGYAFQWFGLSALIAILYVWFQIVRRYRRRTV